MDAFIDLISNIFDVILMIVGGIVVFWIAIFGFCVFVAALVGLYTLWIIRSIQAVDGPTKRKYTVFLNANSADEVDQIQSYLPFSGHMSKIGAKLMIFALGVKNKKAMYH